MISFEKIMGFNKQYFNCPVKTVLSFKSLILSANIEEQFKDVLILWHTECIILFFVSINKFVS